MSTRLPRASMELPGGQSSFGEPFANWTERGVDSAGEGLMARALGRGLGAAHTSGYGKAVRSVSFAGIGCREAQGAYEHMGCRKQQRVACTCTLCQVSRTLRWPYGWDASLTAFARPTPAAGDILTLLESEREARRLR